MHSKRKLKQERTKRTYSIIKQMLQKTFKQCLKIVRASVQWARRSNEGPKDKKAVNPRSQKRKASMGLKPVAVYWQAKSKRLTMKKDETRMEA